MPLDACPLGGSEESDAARDVAVRIGLGLERSLPADTSDPAATLAYSLTQQQKFITRYGELLDRIRGANSVTERLVTSILTDKVAEEDEIESAPTAHKPAA